MYMIWCDMIYMWVNYYLLLLFIWSELILHHIDGVLIWHDIIIWYKDFEKKTITYEKTAKYGIWYIITQRLSYDILKIQ